MNPEQSEPVSAITQVLAVPFVAAVSGAIEAEALPGTFHRVTMHRRMERDGHIFLQQACDYVGKASERLVSGTAGGVGRVFGLDRGLMGAASAKMKIGRTKEYSSAEVFRKDLSADLQETDDKKNPETVPSAYLAVPFLHNGRSVLILYAECDQLNFFACKERLMRIVGMCRGYAGMLDFLAGKSGSRSLRNVPPSGSGSAVGFEPAKLRVYERIEEFVDDPNPPMLERVASFNWDLTTDF